MEKYGEQLEKTVGHIWIYVGLIQRLQARKGARLVIYGGLCSLYLYSIC